MFVCELGGMCGAMLMHVQVRKNLLLPFVFHSKNSGLQAANNFTFEPFYLLM